MCSSSAGVSTSSLDGCVSMLPCSGTSPQAVADLQLLFKSGNTVAGTEAPQPSQRRNKLRFAAGASPSDSPVAMRRVASSPGNLHRHGRPRSVTTPAEEMRKIMRGFAMNALAVGFALLLVSNAQTIATKMLPRGTLDAVFAVVASASENAAAAAAAARQDSEQPSGREGKPLLWLGSGAALLRGRAVSGESNESETSLHDDETVPWQWTHASGAPHESGEVGVLLGSLAVLLVCLLGIRRSIVNEHRAYEAAQAAYKEQRAMAGGSRRF